MNNAYGPDYEPGIGVAGTDEYGKPGYYRADPKAVREAQQRADDAKYSAALAEEKAAEARKERAELEDDPNTTDTDIAGANKAVRDAERAAAVARREAADAATDAAETAKGTFTEAKKVGKKAQSKQGRGGNSELAGLGGIFGSFLKETLGIGDWLPGLDNLIPLQMADSLMGSAMGPLQGFMNGELGIQTPGWRPGMTEEEFAAVKGGGFGLPGVDVPPMPVGGAHPGAGGAPGPMVVNVDNSQNFNNSPVGSDPAQVQKQHNNQINRAPRLPVGMGG